jgi:gamma-glutamyltranspeptidase/glutathione hydrolase
MDAERLASQPSTRSYFLDEAGSPLETGATLENHAYADTLRALASGGADAFYHGPIAARIVEAVRSHAGNPGLLSETDLAAYRVKERPAVCVAYRGHDVCGMGPPSSGGTAVGQILGMLEPFDIGTLGAADPVAWRLIGDATRLAFADRERYLADSDFVSIPHGLLDRAYLESRSALLRRDTPLGLDEVGAGEPPWDKAELREDGPALEIPSTSHFVIVDAAGNVVSMTTSVENGFGARLMTGGFLLNNQLTDFAFTPAADGHNVANRVEPGKRPRSSMAPTIVLRDGRPVFALGSPGGSAIIPYVATTLVALIDWRMDPQSAVSQPHMINRFSTYELERGTAAEALGDDLGALGFTVEIKDLNSGLHAVAWTADGMRAGVDPRREGLAAGD